MCSMYPFEVLLKYPKLDIIFECKDNEIKQ